MDKCTQSKTVIITGASRGIGKTMATLFAINGYNVLGLQTITTLNLKKFENGLTCPFEEEMLFNIKKDPFEGTHEEAIIADLAATHVVKEPVQNIRIYTELLVKKQTYAMRNGLQYYSEQAFSMTALFWRKKS